MKMLLIINLVFFAAPTYALIGSMTIDKGDESVCRILNRDQSGKLIGMCSGTLVTSTKVITAGHCALENVFSTVECGFQGQEGNKKIEETAGGSRVQTSGVKFKEIRTGAILKKDVNYIGEISDSTTDIGIVEFKDPILNIKPAHFLAESKKLFFNPKDNGDVLKPDVECEVQGFGINNIGESGILYSGPLSNPLVATENIISSKEIGTLTKVTPKLVEEIDQCMLKFVSDSVPKNFIHLAELFTEAKTFNSIITQGDSGGPLFCRKNTESEWTIVGIASTVSYAKDDQKNIVSESYWHYFDSEDWEVMIEGKSRSAKIMILPPELPF